jgi:hypothetical protein
MCSRKISLRGRVLKSVMMETELVFEMLDFHTGLSRFTFQENFTSVDEFVITSRLLRCTISKPFIHDNTSVSFRSLYLFYLLRIGVEVVVYFHLITLRHTPQSVGLLWTWNRPATDTSTWQHNHSRETNIHAPVGIRTHNPSKLSAADLQLRCRGQWGRPILLWLLIIYSIAKWTSTICEGNETFCCTEKHQNNVAVSECNWRLEVVCTDLYVLETQVVLNSAAKRHNMHKLEVLLNIKEGG